VQAVFHREHVALLAFSVLLRRQARYNFLQVLALLEVLKTPALCHLLEVELLKTQALYHLLEVELLKTQALYHLLEVEALKTQALYHLLEEPKKPAFEMIEVLHLSPKMLE